MNCSFEAKAHSQIIFKDCISLYSDHMNSTTILKKRFEYTPFGFPGGKEGKSSKDEHKMNNYILLPLETFSDNKTQKNRRWKIKLVETLGEKPRHG